MSISISYFIIKLCIDYKFDKLIGLFKNQKKYDNRETGPERETSEEPPMATKHRPGNDSKQNYEVLRRNQFHFF